MTGHFVYDLVHTVDAEIVGKEYAFKSAASGDACFIATKNLIKLRGDTGFDL